jgi:hypothetical protein
MWSAGLLEQRRGNTAARIQSVLERQSAPTSPPTKFRAHLPQLTVACDLAKLGAVFRGAHEVGDMHCPGAADKASSCSVIINLDSCGLIPLTCPLT